MGLGRELRGALALPPAAWRDAAVAAAELALARARLGQDHSLAIDRDGDEPAPSPALSTAQSHLVERVAFAIPRVARRLPWRADCMVQALAARRWLARHDIASRLTIGVRKDGPAALDAHAWLRVGETLVTGGDVTPFTPLGR